MSTATAKHIVTAEESAELYGKIADPQSKWEFMDSVAALCSQHPALSQREVVEMIADTPAFIALHGHHRDSDKGGKAKSRIKSIKDEITVVKTWPAVDRVGGVSFEAHKVLNRLGSKAGKSILTTLVAEAGGPGNVTKSMVEARLKIVDPDHAPQNNGKVKPAPSAATAGQSGQAALTELQMAEFLADKVTIGDLGKDAALAKAFERLADIFEAFSHRNAAKAAAKAAAPAPAKAPVKAAARKAAAAKPAVKSPTPRRPVVKVPA